MRKHRYLQRMIAMASGALVGAGATKVAMKLTLLPQYLVLLPLLAISVFLGYGLRSGMTIFLGSTVISAMFFAYVWQRETWSSIEL